MAPPARAMPPPTKAPASWTAESETAMGNCLSSWVHRGAGALWWCCGSCGGRAGVVRRGASQPRSVREGGGLALFALLVVLLGMLVVVVVTGTGHGEVQDGQQREDEGL